MDQTQCLSHTVTHEETNAELGLSHLNTYRGGGEGNSEKSENYTPKSILIEG